MNKLKIASQFPLKAKNGTKLMTLSSPDQLKDFKEKVLQPALGEMRDNKADNLRAAVEEMETALGQGATVEVFSDGTFSFKDQSGQDYDFGMKKDAGMENVTYPFNRKNRLRSSTLIGMMAQYGQANPSAFSAPQVQQNSANPPATAQPQVSTATPATTTPVTPQVDPSKSLAEWQKEFETTYGNDWQTLSSKDKSGWQDRRKFALNFYTFLQGKKVSDAGFDYAKVGTYFPSAQQYLDPKFRTNISGSYQSLGLQYTPKGASPASGGAGKNNAPATPPNPVDAALAYQNAQANKPAEILQDPIRNNARYAVRKMPDGRLLRVYEDGDQMWEPNPTESGLPNTGAGIASPTFTETAFGSLPSSLSGINTPEAQRVFKKGMLSRGNGFYVLNQYLIQNKIPYDKAAFGKWWQENLARFTPKQQLGGRMLYEGPGELLNKEQYAEEVAKANPKKPEKKAEDKTQEVVLLDLAAREMSASDITRATLALADAGSAIVSLVPGANLASTFVGVGSSLGTAGLDLTEAYSKGDWNMAGKGIANLMLNLGLDAVSLLPAAKVGKVAKIVGGNAQLLGTLMKNAVKLYGTGALVTAMPTVLPKAVDLLENKDLSDWSGQDYQDFAQAISVLAGTVNLGKQAVGSRKDAKPKMSLEEAEQKGLISKDASDAMLSETQKSIQTRQDRSKTLQGKVTNLFDRSNKEGKALMQKAESGDISKADIEVVSTGRNDKGELLTGYRNEGLGLPKIDTSASKAFFNSFGNKIIGKFKSSDPNQDSVSGTASTPDIEVPKARTVAEGEMYGKGLDQTFADDVIKKRIEKRAETLMKEDVEAGRSKLSDEEYIELAKAENRKDRIKLSAKKMSKGQIGVPSKEQKVTSSENASEEKSVKALNKQKGKITAIRKTVLRKKKDQMAKDSVKESLIAREKSIPEKKALPSLSESRPKSVTKGKPASFWNESFAKSEDKAKGRQLALRVAKAKNAKNKPPAFENFLKDLKSYSANEISAGLEAFGFKKGGVLKYQKPSGGLNAHSNVGAVLQSQVPSTPTLVPTGNPLLGALSMSGNYLASQQTAQDARTARMAVQSASGTGNQKYSGKDRRGLKKNFRQVTGDGSDKGSGQGFLGQMANAFGGPGGSGYQRALATSMINNRILRNSYPESNPFHVDPTAPVIRQYLPYSAESTMKNLTASSVRAQSQAKTSDPLEASLMRMAGNEMGMKAGRELASKQAEIAMASQASEQDQLGRNRQMSAEMTMKARDYQNQMEARKAEDRLKVKQGTVAPLLTEWAAQEDRQSKMAAGLAAMDKMAAEGNVQQASLMLDNYTNDLMMKKVADWNAKNPSDTITQPSQLMEKDPTAYEEVNSFYQAQSQKLAEQNRNVGRQAYLSAYGYGKGPQMPNYGKQYFENNFNNYVAKKPLMKKGGTMSNWGNSEDGTKFKESMKDKREIMKAMSKIQPSDRRLTAILLQSNENDRRDLDRKMDRILKSMKVDYRILRR